MNGIQDFKVKTLILKSTLLLLCSCSLFSQEQINWDFNEELLLVEGKYLFSGRFGNVVIYNPKNQEKEWVTLDSKFDEKPFFTDSGESIVFSSIRRKDEKSHGLSGKKDIYIYDRNKKEISEYFDERKEFSVNLQYASPEKRSILYTQSLYNGYLLLSDSENLEFDQERIQIKPQEILSTYLSPNLNSMVYQFFLMNSNGIYPTLYFYDSEKKEAVNFLNDIIDNQLGKLSDIACSPGSFINNTKFIFSCGNYKKRESKIFSYDYETSIVEEIAYTKKLDIGSPNTKGDDELIYFISRPFSNQDDENIWIYDKKMAKFTQITFSSTEKKWMRVK